MKELFHFYRRIPLVVKMLGCFLLGAGCGLFLWWLGSSDPATMSIYRENLNTYIAPFGLLFVEMLKMVVVPIVFFSLVLGALKLPLEQLGTIGIKLLALYILTSFLSTGVGISVALLVNPASNNSQEWLQLIAQAASPLTGGAPQVHGITHRDNLLSVFFSLFQNPFKALSEGNFLGMIVFALLTGLALTAVSHEEPYKRGVVIIEEALTALNHALYKIVSWVMGYAPIGILALSITNFGIYGPAIIGPYLKVVLGIILGILIMVFVVYGLLIKLFGKMSPIEFFKACREPMVTAFVTRSSAAALPFSIKVATTKLGVSPSVASFALPLGATINMDGVCVHLPMFAILTANLFGLHLSGIDLLVLVVTTVLAAIGTGGVPGGSLMLLFLVLGPLGLSEEQIATIVSLALGVNPILDMFETMNNVMGDLVCTRLLSSKGKS